jgi:uncharacterized protein (UPF0147 family)
MILKELRELTEFQKVVHGIADQIKTVKYEGGSYASSSRSNDVNILKALADIKDELAAPTLKHANEGTEYILEQLKDLAEDALTADTEESKEMLAKLISLQRSVDVAGKTDDDRASLNKLIDEVKTSVKSNGSLFKRIYSQSKDQIPEKLNDLVSEFTGSRFLGKMSGMLGKGLVNLLPSFEKKSSVAGHTKDLLAIANKTYDEQSDHFATVQHHHKAVRERMMPQATETLGAAGLGAGGKIERLEVGSLHVDELKPAKQIEPATAGGVTAAPSVQSITGVQKDIKAGLPKFTEKEEMKKTGKEQTGLLRRILGSHSEQLGFMKKHGLFGGLMAGMAAGAMGGGGGGIAGMIEGGIGQAIFGKLIAASGIGGILSMGKSLLGGGMRALGRGLPVGLGVAGINMAGDALTDKYLPSTRAQEGSGVDTLNMGVGLGATGLAAAGAISAPVALGGAAAWKGGTMLGTAAYKSVENTKFGTGLSNGIGYLADSLASPFSRDARDRLNQSDKIKAAKSLGQLRLNKQQDDAFDQLSQMHLPWENLMTILAQMQTKEDINLLVKKQNDKEIALATDNNQIDYIADRNTPDNVREASEKIATKLNQKNLSVGQMKAVHEAQMNGVSSVDDLAAVAGKLPAPDAARAASNKQIDFNYAAQSQIQSGLASAGGVAKKLGFGGFLGGGNVSNEGIEALTAGETKKGAAGYDQVYGGAKKFGTPEEMFGKPLTQLTFGEVKEWQHKNLQAQVAAGVPGSMRSSAAGKGQFISGTLAETQSKAGIKDNELFDQGNQNKLITQKLNDLGMQDVLSGKMSPEKFMRKVSGTWASVKDLSGKGQDDGIGLNRANVSGKAVFDALTTNAQKEGVTNSIISAQDNIDKAKAESSGGQNVAVVNNSGGSAGGGGGSAQQPSDSGSVGTPSNMDPTIFNNYTPHTSV